VKISTNGPCQPESEIAPDHDAVLDEKKHAQERVQEQRAGNPEVDVHQDRWPHK
jgi:hypothetical protein